VELCQTTGSQIFEFFVALVGQPRTRQRAGSCWDGGSRATIFQPTQSMIQYGLPVAFFREPHHCPLHIRQGCAYEAE
jgi:hypothetical protein